MRDDRDLYDAWFKTEREMILQVGHLKKIGFQIIRTSGPVPGEGYHVVGTRARCPKCLWIYKSGEGVHACPYKSLGSF